MEVGKNNLNSADIYMPFKVSSLKVGETVPFDIFIQHDNDYATLIKTGTHLSETLYVKLSRQKSLFSRREDIEKYGLICTTLETNLSNNQHNIEKSLEFLYKINQKIFKSYIDSQDDKISFLCVGELVKGILYLIHNNPSFLKDVMAHFINEDKLSTHSLNVCIYSMSLGNALALDDEELSKLGIAALLHDVGIKKIDSHIIEKENKLSFKEYERVHQHPLLSVQIIKHNKIFDPYIIEAVTHHHENYDGSGYPDGLIARQISIFSSIISITDVFDALTNTRPNRDAYSSFDALKIMMHDKTMVKKFNLKYMKVFLSLL